MVRRACKECHFISEKTECPACGAKELSKQWQGAVIILDPKRSWIAQEMNIKAPGRYALKVR